MLPWIHIAPCFAANKPALLFAVNNYFHDSAWCSPASGAGNSNCKFSSGKVFFNQNGLPEFMQQFNGMRSKFIRIFDKGFCEIPLPVPSATGLINNGYSRLIFPDLFHLLRPQKLLLEYHDPGLHVWPWLCEA
jgi:hypothetical protein